jgi:hypothetical protein
VGGVEEVRGRAVLSIARAVVRLSDKAARMAFGQGTMKYLCLAYEEESKLNLLSRSEWDVLRRETLDYVQLLRESGYLLAAEPLKSARTAVSLRIRGGRLSATDGPFAETKEQLGGFFLIEARDLNEAIRVASGWPSARIGTIEVRPVEAELRADGRYDTL